MEKIKHKKNQLKKIIHHIKSRHQKKSDPNFKVNDKSMFAGWQGKKVLNIWIKLFAVFILVIISFLIIAGKNSTTAEILIDEFVTALQGQLGFDYNADPLSDYVFSKNTPNYNAYAADKKLAGTHRMLLERDGIKMEIKFKSAAIFPKNRDLANMELTESESTMGATLGSNPIQSAIEGLNSELEEITTGLEDISQKISSLQQEVSEISSKARMMPENNERKVLYQDIVYGTDIVYALGEEGMKQEIILKNNENFHNIFNFTLTLPDLTYKDIGRGVWYFSNNENKIMRIPKGYAIDAKGKFTNDVNIQVKTTLLVTIMTVEIPHDWLVQEERAYPVTVHTAFEIVPNLRDGNSRAPANNEVTVEKVAVTESTDSAVLNASDSAIVEP